MFRIIYETYWFFLSPMICWRGIMGANPHYEWAKMCVEHFKVNVRRVKNGVEPMCRKCLYMTNHRSEADFFMDQYLTHGSSIFLSRRMVALYAFPYLPTSYISKSLLFFVRKKGIRDTLYKQVDQYWKKSSYPSLLVYPEGTRNQTPVSKPLKMGFVYYAYERKLPIQIFISTNKEKVFSLQKKWCSHDTMVRVAYAKPLDPEDYESVDEFKTAVKDVWERTCVEVYDDSSETEALKPYETSLHFFRPAFVTASLCLIMAVLCLCVRFPLFLLYPLLGLLS